MKWSRCCFFSCCCGCVVILMVLVALAVMGVFVVQKGMEVPPGYTKSTVPLDEARGKELAAQLAKGGQEGHLELTLSTQDLRNIVATKINEVMRLAAEGRWTSNVTDVQVGFGSTTDLPAAVVPRAYPVTLDKSVRLDLIVALNFGKPGDEPFIVYPLVKVLWGVSDCALYWTLVDVGLGGYSMLDLFAWAEKVGGRIEPSQSQVEKLPLPPGTCATELSHDGENLRIVFGPEAGAAQPTPAPQ